MNCKCTNGLIPFVKNGKVILNAYLHCPKCHQDKRETYQPLSPADFDFTCSDTWRGYYFEEYTGRDPGYVSPAPEPQTQIVEHRYSDMSKQDYDLLQQVSRKADWLETKLTKRKKKTQDYY